MKRVIFITDIHSYFTKFINLLESNNYNEEEDILILGGDYFDRGPESDLMAKWLIENHKKENIHLIRGNHDDFMTNLFNGIDFMYEFNYKSNGFGKTIKKLISPQRFYDPRRASVVIQRKYPGLKEVIEGLVNYVEIEGIVYTHGALPHNYSENQSEEDWYGARWANSIEFAQTNQVEKQVAIGHWSVQHIHPQYTNYDEPAYIRNVIFCDSGLATGSTEGFAFISELSKD